MPDREPRPSDLTGAGINETAASTSSITDLGPQNSDAGVGEAKPNALTAPQPPIFDQSIIRAIRKNQEAQKLSPADALLIINFLKENGVKRKKYRRMGAKTKVAAATDIVELRIDSYITSADAYAKKRVEERGIAPRENFDSPFGPSDPFTVESQKKAIRNRLWSGIQGDSVQPGTLETVYLREEAISVTEEYLRSNQIPDLYTLWAKTPEDIIIECGLSAKIDIDDEAKKKFLQEEDPPVPFRDWDQYAQDIKESETSIPNEIISGDSESKITSFAKVIEARSIIRRATVGLRDPLYTADAKLKDTFRILANRRILVEQPNENREDATDQLKSLKTNNVNDQQSNVDIESSSASEEPEAGAQTVGEEQSSSDFKERLRKWKEEMITDSQKRLNSLLAEAEKRLIGEIPKEDLNAILDYVRGAGEKIDSEPIKMLLEVLEEQGVLKEKIKNDLQEIGQTKIPRINFAETLMSYIGASQENDETRIYLEKRFGKNLKNISEDEAKKVINSLLENTKIDENLPDPESNPLTSGILTGEKKGRQSKVGKVFGRFNWRKEKEINSELSEENAKNRRLKQLMIVGGVLGIGVIVASVCLSGGGNGKDGSKQVSTDQSTPTISADKELFLTAQAKQTAKIDGLAGSVTVTPLIGDQTPTVSADSIASVTAEAEHGSTTPTVPASEPTVSPTTVPSENPQNPGHVPPQTLGSESLAITTADVNQGDLFYAMDASDGKLDGQKVFTPRDGETITDAVQQDFSKVGNFSKQDIERFSGFIQYQVGHEAKAGETVVLNGDQLQRDVYIARVNNVDLKKDLQDHYKARHTPKDDSIHSEWLQKDIDQSNKEAEKIAEFTKKLKPQTLAAAASETSSALADTNHDGGITDNSEMQSNFHNGTTINNENISDKSDNFGANSPTVFDSNDIGTKSTQLVYGIATNYDKEIIFTKPPVLETVPQKIFTFNYIPISDLRFRRDDDMMKFVAAILYQRERQKLLKKFRLNLNTTDDDEAEEDFDLLANS